MDIRNAFEAIATDEDRARRLLVPCFDEFLGAVVRAIPFAADDDFSVLDLGAGTGLLTAIILSQFPKARVTLVDVNEENLKGAGARLAAYGGQLTYLQADFARTDPPREFDAVVSMLALHHISDLDKRTLYRSLYYALNRLGSVIIADRLHGPTAATYELYKTIWQHEVRELGATDAAIEKVKSSQTGDYHSTLNEHLDWMRNSGFLDVDVHYKNAMFAVFGGHRPDV